MNLVSMVRTGGGTIVPDGHGQKMELDIGVVHCLVAADKSAGLKMVGGRSTFFMEEPLVTNPGLVVPFRITSYNVCYKKLLRDDIK